MIANIKGETGPCLRRIAWLAGIPPIRTSSLVGRPTVAPGAQILFLEWQGFGMFQAVKRDSHRLIDRVNAAQDRLIARRIRRDGRVLVLARRNLRRWIDADGRTVRPVFKEWDLILQRLTRSEIATFLASDTPMARRLRQSSPFAGVLSDRERLSIRRAHEKAGV